MLTLPPTLALPPTATRTLIRLNLAEATSWALYPVWEQRVIEANARLSAWIPPEALKTHLRQRWLENNITLGAWLLVDEEGRAIAHACGWVEVQWSMPIIFIFQVVANDGVRITDFRDDFLASVKTWRERVNALYAKANSPLRIQKIRFATERGDEWSRYLRTHIPATRLLTTVEME